MRKRHIFLFFFDILWYNYADSFGGVCMNNEYEYYEEVEEKDDYIPLLSFIATWFIRIGIVVAAILFAVFLFTGKIMTALLYIIGLVIAFLFGYAIMFLIDFFLS